MVRPMRRGRSYGSDGAWRQRARALAEALLAFAVVVMSGAQASAAPDRPLRIVALGDSLTAGYNLPGPAAFPSVLERALKARGREVEIANAGVSGDTANGGLERLDWSVPEGTDGVILELGANDMLRGTDPAATARALDAIVGRLKARGIPVMLAGMYAARNMGEAYVARFEGIYTDLAARYGLLLYPFFLDGVTGVERMTLKDGLHPSEAGVRVIVERILPTVEEFLGSLRPKG